MPSSKTSWRGLAQIGVFAYPFGNNVRAPSRASSGVATPLRIDDVAAKPPAVGRNFCCAHKYAASGSRPFSRAIVALVRRLGLVGKVEVFKFRLVKRSFDARLQLIGQLALLGDWEARMVSRRLARSRK